MIYNGLKRILKLFTILHCLKLLQRNLFPKITKTQKRKKHKKRKNVKTYKK